MMIKHYPKIIPHSSIRVLICSDAKNEADDQFAIVHALLTPRFKIQGLIAGHFGKADSMAQSFLEMQHILKIMQMTTKVPIAHGAKQALSSKTNTASTEGSQLIVQTALTQAEQPLFVLCLGALTDVAMALRETPEIAKKMTVIWVGGGRYPHGSNEANLQRDRLAANEVFAANVPLWQIPSQAYKTLLAPLSELRQRVAPTGEIGNYLYTQLVNFANDHLLDKPWINSECWVLGDSASVGVLLANEKSDYIVQTPPFFNQDNSHDMQKLRNCRPIRVYQHLNTAMILSDFYAKLALYQHD